MDVYQQRYLAHQKKKKEQLSPQVLVKPKEYTENTKEELRKVFENRHSQRIFTGPVSDEEIEYILYCALQAPSSCNRKGVSMKAVTERADKEVLGGLLVGGVGWAHRADKIILLFADMEAYKNPVERENMPYLDAGVIVQSVYMASEVLGVGCCYINPNIREENKAFFKEKFGHHLFCGALALGKY